MIQIMTTLDTDHVRYKAIVIDHVLVHMTHDTIMATLDTDHVRYKAIVIDHVLVHMTHDTDHGDT